jgi:hypothetical protein
VGKPKGKRPLGRPRHRWEDEIRMDLGVIGWGEGGVLIGFYGLRTGTGGRLCECSDELSGSCAT